jgi:hypothetical protein
MSFWSAKLTKDEKQHKRMILSSRASPPKPLKFNANPTDRYLSIRHLLPSTPIPSPSLPSILPRHGKKPPKLNSRKIVRAIFYLTVLIGLYQLISVGKKSSHQLANFTFSSSLGKTYEIVGASELPEYPTPLAVTDSKGKPRWTISIPESLGFPLPGVDYADICSQAEEVARHVAGKNYKPEHEHEHYSYGDSNYLDVDVAQAQHFLPANTQVSSHGSNKDLPICEKSLTYVLDATDAGLGSTLLGLWLSYALAQQEHRAFFIDDAHFAYGRYSTYFSSPQSFFPKGMPVCRRPPPSHLVPCPRQAKHLAISASTTSWVFGSSFHSYYSRREIFAMARTGYETLFHLNFEDTAYITSRASKLRQPSPTNKPIPQSPDEYPFSIPQTGLIGIHIRRGDRHPFSHAYSHSYIPPSTYYNTALSLIGKSTNHQIIVATDDADLYADHVDLPNTLRAQTKISLASKKHLEKSGQPGGLGWEGGFFEGVFWGLGLSEAEKFDVKRRGDGHGSPLPMKVKGRYGEKDEHGKERRVHHHQPHHIKGTPGQVLAEQADAQRDYRTHPTESQLKLREFIGRAYLLDLAVLKEADRVVCGVSSYGCRILAVMMGWERSMERGEWSNVEAGYEWRALDY